MDPVQPVDPVVVDPVDPIVTDPVESNEPLTDPVTEESVTPLE